jgi:phosphopantothenoylcysteine synthetase/decarboxylase
MHPENDMVRCVPDYLQMNGKISSSHDSLTMELVPTEKIVDRVRDPWAFQGTLVKFKLQVDMSDDELLSIAMKSQAASKADIMVANCLEWAREYAYILDPQGVSRVARRLLAATLLEKLEEVAQ